MSSSYESKKAKHESTSTNPNWLELPRDITLNILQRLGAVQILMNARNVCPDWWNICKDPVTWRQIHMLDLLPYVKLTSYGGVYIDFLAKLCKYAVDLSCGHLEEIYICEFGTDHLLQHIADRASNLRCIRLYGCKLISNEGWCEFVKKFSMLEEIHILNSELSRKSLEVIGQNCPLLKSLTFNGKWYGKPSKWDAEASIIAKTMPKLTYLDIYGNALTVVGLFSILDACPLLESLNIQRCSNLKVGASLLEILYNRIKDLRAKEFFSDAYDAGYDSCSEWVRVMMAEYREHVETSEDEVEGEGEDA
ncbi:hypothetical protein KIW84_053509 [Lathyrus oleraceus]|uniref:F-box domain-containing protein n=1 Tax=Pisum sativum TaxID=3888 RepID=A0A9D4WV99_PEA|nr:hypothetical protein KIW84_053509 [Pisum sativum]